MSDIKDSHIDMINAMFGDNAESVLDDLIINEIFGEEDE